MVQAMGFSNLATGFVVALVFAVAMLVMNLWGRSSDLRRERFWHVALPMFVAALGFLAASLAMKESLVLGALFIVVSSVSAAAGVYWSIPSSFLRGPAAAASIAFANCNSSLGGFLGPVIIGVLKGRSGTYSSSMVVLALGLVLGALIVLALGRAMAPRPAMVAPKAGGAWRLR
jgi:ACS family tartrate transporter-like MFS transporter